MFYNTYQEMVSDVPEEKFKIWREKGRYDSYI